MGEMRPVLVFDRMSFNMDFLSSGSGSWDVLVRRIASTGGDLDVFANHSITR